MTLTDYLAQLNPNVNSLIQKIDAFDPNSILIAATNHPIDISDNLSMSLRKVCSVYKEVKNNGSF